MKLLSIALCALAILAGCLVVSLPLPAFLLDELKKHHAALVYAVVGIAGWWRERVVAAAPLPCHA